MKIFLFALVLGGVGYIGYQKFMTKSPAVKAYERFADLLARERYQEAKDLSSGEAASAVSAMESMGRGKVGPNIRGMAPHRDQMIREVAGTVATTTQRIEQQTKGGDGATVHLTAVSNVCREQPGCTGMPSRCNKCLDFRHEVDMCNERGTWTVCGFVQSE
jgi:hypothetical protein